MSASANSTPQQYCLRWNNYQNNLTNVFDQLLQSEAFVDVTLACDGHSLKAHKILLSACSPYFQSLFFDNPCTHPIVILKDIRWEELKAVVEFMYRGEINVSQEQLAPLLRVAEVLKVRGLADVSRGGSGEFVRTPSTFDNDLNGLGNPPSGTSLNLIAQGLRRKRRKLSNLPDDRSQSPLDHFEGAERMARPDLESNDGEYHRESPMSGGGTPAHTPSVNPSPSPSSTSALGSLVNLPGSSSSIPTTLTSIGPTALLSIHSGGPGSSGGGGGGGDRSSSISNEMDLKPGIVEMIREEERAKMLESSHGWLGPSGSSLQDSYQYQLQNLWQKCWSNQPGVVHALRFRERGPLKSWRPETMAEAIFAVLREGLSLSQAARKFDIPYPTFVLYANRVHNMLGPSADGCSGDLLSDIRPKGRGRPQRILLGSWPEDHIRGVIRAVVFRDSGAKDDGPFSFNGRELLMNQAGSSNGLDMSLHPGFGFGGSSQSSSTCPTPNNNSQEGRGGHGHASSSSSPSQSPLHAPSSSAYTQFKDLQMSITGPNSASPRFVHRSSSESNPSSSPLVLTPHKGNLLKGTTPGAIKDLNLNESQVEMMQIKAEMPFDPEEEEELSNSEEEDLSAAASVRVVTSPNIHQPPPPPPANPGLEMNTPPPHFPAI